MIDAYIAENCGVSKEIDIRNIFDEIIIPPENATVKDQRDGVLRLAIALSGQEPHKVIAIERTLEGVERAVRLGVDSVAVCDMYDFNQEYIRALATFSENDFYVLIQKLEK